MYKIKEFLQECVCGERSLEEQIKFLEFYQPENLSEEDLFEFANFMRLKMSSYLEMPDCIDICGTGGSGLSRINTSTLAAFILADLGVGIAKHGNKAASGRVGSFDLLEALGVDIERKNLEEIYDRLGLAFIYARNFHPVMKHFAEARAAFGKPTVFNILGPLLNPANPERQIIGTAFRGQMRLIAETCRMLGKKRVMVVCGEDGLDEVTLNGRTFVVELLDGKVLEYEISPEDFGVDRCEIVGGNLEENVRLAKEILGGNGEKCADLVYVNAALALKLVGVSKNLKEGYKLAKTANGLRKLAQYKGDILEEIAATKILQKSERDFLGALKSGGIIAEIKKASPSEGIIREDFNVEEIARIYEEGGARAISVLTDCGYFQGSFENLRIASKNVDLPILCKDFIVEEYQIYKAREFGADAILLIAALLDVEKMQKFLKIAENLGMDCLVEIHNEEEIEKALESGANIIGVNSRNLKTFEIDMAGARELVKKIPEDKIVVFESGIKNREDIPEGVDAVLIGTALMKSSDIKQKLYELT